MSLLNREKWSASLLAKDIFTQYVNRSALYLTMLNEWYNHLNKSQIVAALR